jgi:hypothetical protein
MLDNELASNKLVGQSEGLLVKECKVMLRGHHKSVSAEVDHARRVADWEN